MMQMLAFFFCPAEKLARKTNGRQTELMAVFLQDRGCLCFITGGLL